VLNPRAYNLFPEITKELELLEQHFDDSGKSSEPAARLYIRVAFSVLEAEACIIRDKALQGLLARFEKTKSLNITAAHFLEDYSYRLTSTGQLERQEHSDLPFAAHFAFSVRTLADVAEVPQNYIQGPGWDSFQRAVKVRNRITHPKTENDLRLSEDDIERVHEGIAWAFNTLVDIFSKSPVFSTPDEMPKN
jgi:hypothetical protein